VAWDIAEACSVRLPDEVLKGASHIA